ncbi:DUF4190 domain-containing protein [Miniimonas arenae]|uniref:DUF4190 domain-containing protein n=1 Tax=Miniimonas arenae TaxID=676201 RepID=UPI0015D62DA9|nr:DUF4190 domain-containing protein [Miniimonas arenae]
MSNLPGAPLGPSDPTTPLPTSSATNPYGTPPTAPLPTSWATGTADSSTGYVQDRPVADAAPGTGYGYASAAETAYAAPYSSTPYGSPTAPQPYVTQPYVTQQAVRPTNQLAIIGFICSLAGVATGISVFVGIVLGHIALSQIRRDPNQEGRGFAVAALAIGYGLLALGVLFVLFWVVVLASVAGASSYG